MGDDQDRNKIFHHLVFTQEEIIRETKMLHDK